MRLQTHLKASKPAEGFNRRKQDMARRNEQESFDDVRLELDSFLPFELAVVANRVSQMIGNLIQAKFDLQVPDWRILVTLDRFGPLPPNEVAEKTSMDKARVSRAQRRLSDLKLVAISDDPDDGRRKVLSLERLGHQVCREIVPEALERQRWLLESLSPAEEVALRSILAKLHRHTEGVSLGGPDETDHAG
jgi:DNA-binding MarR family transcriptional regulator